MPFGEKELSVNTTAELLYDDCHDGNYRITVYLCQAKGQLRSHEGRSELVRTKIDSVLPFLADNSCESIPHPRLPSSPLSSL